MHCQMRSLAFSYYAIQGMTRFPLVNNDFPETALIIKDILPEMA